MKKKKNTQLGILVVMALMILSVVLPFTAAFGVTSPYWDNRPLTMHPGETIEFELILQNMVGGEDLTMEAEVVDGAAFATLTDSTTVYAVPFGTNDVPVKVRVTIPNETSLGPIDRIGISFTPIRSGEGEMVELGAAVKTDIPLIVDPWPKAPERKFPLPVTALAGAGILILIILIVIGVVVARRRRNEKI